MFYPAEVKPSGERWVVTFPDFPGTRITASSREQAIQLAFDALLKVIGLYLNERQQVPLPSDAEEGQVPFAIPPSIARKVLRVRSTGGPQPRQPQVR